MVDDSLHHFFDGTLYFLGDLDTRFESLSLDSVNLQAPRKAILKRKQVR